jgi:EPS-associated MarR family transcriptional regulator
MLTDEYRYKIFKLLESNPEISQRQLAGELGISLGKANYCLKALIEKGLLKAGNFRNSKNKLAYAYKLILRGIEEKASVTVRFLKKKIREYEQLEQEIKELRKESLKTKLTEKNVGQTSREDGNETDKNED